MKSFTQLLFVFLFAVSFINPVCAGSVTAVKARTFKAADGKTIAFPDTCITSINAGPGPAPYPNIAKSTSNTSNKKTPVPGAASKSGNTRKPLLLDFSAGDYLTKGGGAVKIKSSDSATGEAVQVELMSASGAKTLVTKSQVIELDDGSFCAICMHNGKVTKIERLVKEVTAKKPTLKQQKVQPALQSK